MKQNYYNKRIEEEMTPAEEQVMVELIEDYAEMIGLKLVGSDIQDILTIYVHRKRYTDDVQVILLDAIYAMQEERVKKSSLVVK